MKLLLIILLVTSPLIGQYRAVLFNGSGKSAEEQLLAMTLAGIVNRDSARVYLLNVYEAWSFQQSDEQWRDLYRSRGNVLFDSIHSVDQLVEKFRPFIHGGVRYNAARLFGNFPGQSFRWQGEAAAVIGGLTDRLPVTAELASRLSLSIENSLTITDPFDGDSAVSVPGKVDSAGLIWNNGALTEEQAYLSFLQWGIDFLLPRSNPGKMYIREITDFTVRHRMFQVNLAGTDELKLDSMPKPRADILEQLLLFYRQKNPASVFHIYGWIRPEPMTQWFAHYGASMHETLMGNLSWHGSFPQPPRTWTPASALRADTLTLENKYYVLFLGSEGDAANWNIAFQSGAWLSPKRGSVPVNWGWNLHLLEQMPFVASYYYDTATPNDGFVSVTSPLGYAYPDLWPSEVKTDAVTESRRLMETFGVRNVYGYKHYEGKGTATYRGKTISNSFNFPAYGSFQQSIGAPLTVLFDPQLPLQVPVTTYGGLLLNHCDDGSFYGNASNISTMANRILSLLKGKPKPFFLVAGYNRFRQDDFGIRPSPTLSDISVPRLEQLLQLMAFDTTAGKHIEAVTIERFSGLLRKHSGLTRVSEETGVPTAPALGQNYPNPFNPVTVIPLELPEPGEATITVTDILGRNILTLPLGRRDAGRHTVRFDGASLSAGVYFYTLSYLSADDRGRTQLTRRMVLLK